MAKYRIVEHKNEPYNPFFYTQVKVLGIFWKDFNKEFCPSYVMATCYYDTYDEALEALKEKLNIKGRKQKFYYYVDINEINKEFLHG